MAEDTKDVSHEDFVDRAKETIGQFKLPSGYLDQQGILHRDILIREMTGAEEDLLVSGSASVFQTLIERCVVELGTFKQTDPNWSKIMKSLPYSDHVFMLIRLRTVSLGRQMSFSVKCPSCAKTSNQAVDLFDFVVQGLKDPTSRRTTVELPSGAKVILNPATLEDEEKCKMIKDLATRELAMRCEAINGNIPTVESLKALSFRDRRALSKMIREYEGEIDNEVEMICPHCSHMFKSEVSVWDRNFFFPSEI